MRVKRSYTESTQSLAKPAAKGSGRFRPNSILNLDVDEFLPENQPVVEVPVVGEKVASEEVFSELVEPPARFKLSLDLGAKKIVITSLLFLFMFVLPVVLFRNWDSISSRRTNPYTASTISQGQTIAQGGNQVPSGVSNQANEGRVAGVSTDATTQTAATSQNQNGSVAWIFIAGGLFLIIIPLVILFRA